MTETVERVWIVDCGVREAAYFLADNNQDILGPPRKPHTRMGLFAERTLPVISGLPLPSEKVRILYLQQYDTASTFKVPLQYLHTRRAARYALSDGWIAQVRDYYAGVAAWASDLAEQVRREVEPDYVVQAPANDPCGDPYFAAVALATGAPASPRHQWIKQHGHSAGSIQGNDATSTFKAITYRFPKSNDEAAVREMLRVALSRPRRIVVIDDVFATGKTLAATWARLLELGLAVTADVIAAVPLLVDTSG